MRRNVIVALLVTLLTLPALGCKRGPTATPTATSHPAEPSVTPTVPPTATPIPTPTPIAGPIDLGVPAGDAYSPQAMAVDGARGLAYVVSSYGDAAESEDQSVLSVIDVIQGEVEASVALPHAYRGSTSMVLAPAGDRLFIAGGDDNLLLVVGTGTVGEPLGSVLSVQSDVRVIALDAVSLRLYAVGADQIRVYDVNTLEELQRAEVPAGLPAPPSEVFIAVNPQTSTLYIGSPNADIVAVYRTDDLQKVADILPGGQPMDVIASSDSPQAYLMLHGRADSPDKVAVIEGKQVIRVWQPETGFSIQGVIRDDVHDRAFLWETDYATEYRLRAVDPISGQTLDTISLPTHSITESAVSAGRLHLVTWNNVFVSVAVDSGDVESIVRLGVTLRDALVDQESGRLFVIDSAGTVHVLDAASLRQVDTWSRIVGTGTEYIYAAPLSAVGGHLFVPDYDADETAVVEIATGERVARIPRAGQVTFDSARNRLFVTRQGVFIVDPETYTVVDSIDDTVRKTLFSGEPSAMAAEYDAKHDLLFVTMTNNVPGSSARTWLQIYHGETLQPLDTNIKTDQQFLSGLANDLARDRVYVASGFPGSDLAVFTIRGELLARLRHLSGQLFLDEARDRLYVTDWYGVVTLDTTTHDVIDYRRLPTDYGEFTVYDAAHERFYATKYNTADLLILESSAPEPTISQTVSQLPAEQIRYLAVADEATVFAANDDGSVYRQTGDGWELVSGMLPPLGWPAVHPAPGAPTVLFAHLKQTGQAFGLFRSQDGGRTWQLAVRGLKDFDVRDLVLSPDFATDSTAFLLSREDGIFRSTDGGETWQHVSDVAGWYIALASTAQDPATFLMLAQKPDAYDETQVYAPVGISGSVEQVGTIGSGMLPAGDALALSPDYPRDGTAIAGLYRAGLFLSQDFGHTWRQLPPRPEAFSSVYTIRFSPSFASDRTVYALLAPSYFGQEDRSAFYRSADGGQTWQRAMDADPLISALAMGPDGQLWVGDTQGDVRRLDPTQLTWEIALEPTPTPVPTPAEPPAGFYRPAGAFAELWATDPEVRRALGWAAEPGSRQVSTAFQPFEGGVMIWRADTRTIYVLYHDGSWDGFEDTWTPDQPDRDPNVQPPPGREQPVRGFGKIWREQQGVRERLGWALQSEEGYASPIQGFERGTAIGIASSVYALARVADEPATWLSR
ncbi:MAG: hypothetical protein ACE5LU_16865 [Anaerolineae bacterium]